MAKFAYISTFPSEYTCMYSEIFLAALRSFELNQQTPTEYLLFITLGKIVGMTYD